MTNDPCTMSNDRQPMANSQYAMSSAPSHQPAPLRPHRCSIHHSRLITRSGGFTLMEVMFAIGIMGIGMIMIASLFPTAIKESNTSYNKTFGLLVAKNGLAVAKAVFTHPGPADGVWADENTTGTLSAKSQHYQELEDSDLADGDLLEGFVIIGKQMPSGGNDYLIFSIAYARPKDTSGNTIVTAEQVTVDSATDTNTLTVSSGSGDLRTGSPIIFATDNSYATIIQVSGSEIILDREVTVTGQQAYVIVESGTSAGDDSPALTVISTRTSLGE